MSAGPSRRTAARVPGWSVTTALRASLAVVLLLGTLGSFGVGFGLMTRCTDTYSCTATGCPPCATTNAWLTAGWAGQGLLLLIGLVLAVLASRHVRPPAVRVAALLLAPVSIALLVATTALAAAAG
jgi:hypothetical protein